MNQRDIYLANLHPIKGHEQDGTRPVVIISGDTMNKHLGIYIICPISSKIKNYASSVQLKKNQLNQLSTDSEIITFQVRTIAGIRLIKKIGQITEAELNEAIYKLNEVLKY